jgi:hypothetical protein
MALVVDCPSCTRKLRLPDDLLGRTVRCAHCAETFEAKATPAPVSSPSPILESAPPPPYEKPNFDDAEPCPRCGEEVPARLALPSVWRIAR